MADKKELVMDWFRVFGWHSSPFENEILEPINDFVVGHEQARQKINYFLIESHRFGTIATEAGNGKTMLLTWLKRELEKYPNKVIVDYFVGGNKDFVENIVWNLLNLREKAYVKSLVNSPLRKGVGFLRAKMRTSGHSLFDLFTIIRNRKYKADEISLILDFIKKKAQQKQLVVLIDDIELLSQRNLLFLKMLLFNHFPLQIIIAGTPQGVKKSNVQNFGEKDKLCIKLKSLDYDEFRDLISKRISYYGGRGIYPFGEDQLKRLYERGNKNIKRTLNLCADVAIKLALKQKKHERVQIVKQNDVIEATGGEFEEFEKSADINKILTNVEVAGKKQKVTKKEEEDYIIKVIERTPASYKVKEKSSHKKYNIKEKKKKK